MWAIGKSSRWGRQQSSLRLEIGILKAIREQSHEVVILKPDFGRVKQTAPSVFPFRGATSLSPTSPSKIAIVGIGDDGPAGLTESARALVDNADILLGAESTLALLHEPAPRAPIVALDPDMPAALEQVRSALGHERPVLVSYGDPLFYGVARYLMDRMGKDRFEVIPHVSSMQLAFARIKENWDDAYLTSLAGRSLESVLDRIRTAEKVGLFAGDDLPPKRLAKTLLDHHIDYFSAYVCEHLGQPDERVTHASLAELQSMDFDPLHVLILVREHGRPDRATAAPHGRRLFGNSDDLFQQSRPRRGLITQAEVRAIALAVLDVRPASVVWDIGAGSGSVAIEAAQLAPHGAVFAIESDSNEHALLQANAEAFGVSNVHLVSGRAPACLASLPRPDAVFVGATGRQLGAVLRSAFDHLAPGGALVINVATLEALATAHQVLKELAGEVRLWQFNFARGIEQLDRVRFQAVNPSFLLAVTKQKPVTAASYTI